MSGIAISSLLLLLLSLVSGEKCARPPPSAGYSSTLLVGTWYEVGRYQTAGGAKWQEGNVCTTATYKIPDDNTADQALESGYFNRKGGPDGPWINATGVMTGLEQPGNFRQQLTFFGRPGNPVNLTVVHLDGDSSLIYDCHDDADGGVEYCAHLLSRSPTISDNKLQQLQSMVKELQLNVLNLDYKVETHAGCHQDQ